MPDKPKYFTIIFRVDEAAYDRIQDLKKQTGLSAREIIGYSSQPCSCCPDAEVRAYNSKDKKIGIPRGILYESLLTKHQEYKKVK